MTQSEIVKYLIDNIGKPKVMALSNTLVTEKYDLQELIDITFHPDQGVGFRAVWALEFIVLDHPTVFYPCISYFYSTIKEVTNGGCKRHYAKITMHITDKKAPIYFKRWFADNDVEPVVEQLFDWLIDPKVNVAVKAFVAEALFNLRNRYDWIAEELANQLEFLMKDGSPAIQARGKKLLKGLKS